MAEPFSQNLTITRQLLDRESDRFAFDSSDWPRSSRRPASRERIDDPRRDGPRELVMRSRSPIGGRCASDV